MQRVVERALQVKSRAYEGPSRISSQALTRTSKLNLMLKTYVIPNSPQSPLVTKSTIQLLLDIADEFIDSVGHFACRLARHRGSDSLEVRDLQLHLERNHNIRIPGFASDETRMSMSQATIGPPVGVGPAGTGGGASGKKGAQSNQMTLRAQRLAQVAAAKKEAKLM